MIVVSVLIRVIIDLMRLEEHLLLLTQAVFLLGFMESENKEKGSRSVFSRKGQVSGLDIYTKQLIRSSFYNCNVHSRMSLPGRKKTSHGRENEE